jgi:hypothetical protein
LEGLTLWGPELARLDMSVTIGRGQDMMLTQVSCNSWCHPAWLHETALVAIVMAECEEDDDSVDRFVEEIRIEAREWI